MSTPPTDSQIHRAKVIASDSATGEIKAMIPSVTGLTGAVPVSFWGRELHIANSKWLVPDVGDTIVVCREDEDYTNVFWINTTVPPDPPYTFDDDEVVISLSRDFTVGGTSTLSTTTFADSTVSRAMLKDYSETTADNPASGATATIDLVNGNVHTVLMTANCTFTFSNPIASDDCSSFTLILTQDGTGSRTVTWPASVKWPGGDAPLLTTTATTGRDLLMFVTVDGGTTWLGSSLLDFS